jgi:hypothetical protein
MEQSNFWEADSGSGGLEIPHRLWKPKIHYQVHNKKYFTLFWARWI